jgi:hypothetical protein
MKKIIYALCLFVILFAGSSTGLNAQVNVQVNPFPPVYVNPPGYGYQGPGAYPYPPGAYGYPQQPGIYINPGPRFYGNPYRHYGYGRSWGGYGYGFGYGRGWRGYRHHHHRW